MTAIAPMRTYPKDSKSISYTAIHRSQVMELAFGFTTRGVQKEIVSLYVQLSFILL